ncbi:unnamed protein product [Closterium sp. NIES-54]
MAEPIRFNLHFDPLTLCLPRDTRPSPLLSPPTALAPPVALAARRPCFPRPSLSLSPPTTLALPIALATSPPVALASARYPPFRPSPSLPPAALPSPRRAPFRPSLSLRLVALPSSRSFPCEPVTSVPTHPWSQYVEPEKIDLNNMDEEMAEKEPAENSLAKNLPAAEDSKEQVEESQEDDIELEGEEDILHAEIAKLQDHAGKAKTDNRRNDGSGPLSSQRDFAKPN